MLSFVVFSIHARFLTYGRMVAIWRLMIHRFACVTRRLLFKTDEGRAVERQRH